MKTDELKKAQRTIDDAIDKLEGILHFAEEVKQAEGDAQGYAVMARDVAHLAVHTWAQYDADLWTLQNHVFSVLTDELKRALADGTTYSSLRHCVNEIIIQLQVVIYWTDGPTFAQEKWIGRK